MIYTAIVLYVFVLVNFNVAAANGLREAYDLSNITFGAMLIVGAITTGLSVGHLINETQRIDKQQTLSN